jgi:hypothetical protein
MAFSKPPDVSPQLPPHIRPRPVLLRRARLDPAAELDKLNGLPGELNRRPVHAGRLYSSGRPPTPPQNDPIHPKRR